MIWSSSMHRHLGHLWWISPGVFKIILAERPRAGILLGLFCQDILSFDPATWLQHYHWNLFDWFDCFQNILIFYEHRHRDDNDHEHRDDDHHGDLDGDQHHSDGDHLSWMQQQSRRPQWGSRQLQLHSIIWVFIFNI